MIKFYFPDEFADKHATEPNFNLVNKDSLDKILKVEVFVNSNGQFTRGSFDLRIHADLIKLPSS